MKVEQLVVQYLYNHKKVTLQDIGSFTIAPEVVIPAENEKDAQLPLNAISFEYDPKAKQDDGLVDFIVQQTRKIKPLATSDLESYSILSRQFLNIGKPLHIEGLGTLLKKQNGSYEFAQGITVNPRLGAAPMQMKEKQQDEIDFSSPEKPRSSKKGWLLLIVLLVLAGIGFSIYYLYNKQKNDTSIEKVEPVQDTSTLVVPVITDTTKKITVDSTAAPSSDGYSFKVVIKEYATKAAADKAYKRLTDYGHTLVLSPLDSVRYKIAIPFNTPLSDTTRAKDSLSKFFQSKAYIDPR
jgi:hypothetical protein